MSFFLIGGDKVKSTAELPDWFNLQNYEQLCCIDANSLYDELLTRKHMVNTHGNWESCWMDWSGIVSGKVLINSNNPNQKTSRRRLDHGQAVSSLSIFEAHQFSRDYEKLIGNGIDDFNFNDEPSDVNERELKKPWELRSGSVYMSLNLEFYSDQQIIHELKQLLPKWRKKFGVSEIDLVDAKPSEIRKVIDYRLIPFIDLSIWALLENKHISSKIYAAALFPFGEKGVDEYKQTLLPFYSKVWGTGYTIWER